VFFALNLSRACAVPSRGAVFLASRARRGVALFLAHPLGCYFSGLFARLLSLVGR
jgi:hypothetical protein